mgnify:CR=1 FL=1
MKYLNLPVDVIISKLGYEGSNNLIKSSEINQSTLPSHSKKIINEIRPYATYVVENRPFILFFDAVIQDENSFKEISKCIWNAQIPVAIFCGETSVKVYNGTALDFTDFVIKQVKEFSTEECSDTSDFSFWNIADPMFWAKYSEHYSNEKLNKKLLENISYLTSELKNRFHISFATRLVLRLIFIRYLIDRGVDLGYKNFSSDKEKSKKEKTLIILEIILPIILIILSAQKFKYIEKCNAEVCLLWIVYKYFSVFETINGFKIIPIIIYTYTLFHGLFLIKNDSKNHVKRMIFNLVLITVCFIITFVIIYCSSCTCCTRFQICASYRLCSINMSSNCSRCIISICITFTTRRTSITFVIIFG